MSEIRNLTRNGETFYPLTHVEGLINKDGSSVEIINDIFDISEYNASGTPPVLAKYATLALALAAIPSSKQKGGMTIRFILQEGAEPAATDKYVQYRLMKTTWSTTVSDWQSLNADDEPIAGSESLVTSGGVYSSTPSIADSSTESDLDISDENGNVLARFANGHIQVKNFSSDDFKGLMFLANISACKYSGNLMHISFDDTSSCLNTLFSQIPESIYDVTFFNNLRTLHNTYGACFSCYVQVESLANVNNNYASEFQAVKNWLKWNFHTLNDKQYKDGTSIDSDYTLGISRLLTMVGNDKECLDHQMRGNYWELSLANAEYVRDNTIHSSYIFCAKDPFSPSAGNYYLDSEQKEFVFNNGFLIDAKNRVLFIQTCARLDDEEKTLASKEYITNNLKWQKSCEVLNHEWAFNNSRMSAFLDWAKNTMDFRFGFFDDIYKF